MFES
ncbi:Receptor-type guanylate cyclase Gyc76C, partial [Araneus ventricosus]|jgi:hypothetical protein